jgi:hypothetical protein
MTHTHPRIAIVRDHGFVNEIILLPDFGQDPDKLIRMMATVASGPVP